MSSLTVEELKKALNKSGIQLPGGKAKKEEYVKLYEENVALNASIADTYSSDEESSQSSKKVTSTNSLNDSQSIPESVEYLSDEEIFEKLKELGYNAGPIVANTRSVYLKKLVQLLQGVSNISYTNGGGNAVHELDISDNELEIQPQLHTKRFSVEREVRGSPAPGTSKRDRTPSLEPSQYIERPVTRIDYTERVPRQRVSNRQTYKISDGPIDGSHFLSSPDGDLKGYVGRWSPRVSLNRIDAPSKRQKQPVLKKNLLLIIVVLIIIIALGVVGYYQWTVNDPYQQLQEDAENEVKKLEAQKSGN